MPPFGSMTPDVQEVAPAGHDQGAGHEHRGIPGGAAERLPEVPEEVLQHEAADPGPRIDGREDEDRLEHEREVIPRCEQGVAEGRAEDARHAHRERRCAAGAGEQRPLAHAVRELLHLVDRHREAPAGNGRHGGVRIRTDYTGAGIDRKVHARIEQRRRDHRHDRDEGLQCHAAVADQAHVRLAADELGGRAAGDQRMKARHRAAGDGDEDERKDLAGEDRPVARR